MYKKVTYREFTTNEASYDMQLAMVERSTSRILWSESFHHKDKDEIHYVEFSGTGDLFSGNWRYQNNEHPSDHRRNDSRSMNRLVKPTNAFKAPPQCGRMPLVPWLRRLLPMSINRN